MKNIDEQLNNNLIERRKERAPVGRKTKEIKVVLHLPESEYAIRQFEKKICNFYASQVEQRLSSLSKEQKLEALQALITNYST